MVHDYLGQKHFKLSEKCQYLWFYITGLNISGRDMQPWKEIVGDCEDLDVLHLVLDSDDRLDVIDLYYRIYAAVFISVFA